MTKDIRKQILEAIKRDREIRKERMKIKSKRRFNTFFPLFNWAIATYIIFWYLPHTTNPSINVLDFIAICSMIWGWAILSSIYWLKIYRVGRLT